MAADQVQFQQLLNSLLSTDNDVRQQAEVGTINYINNFMTTI